MGLWGRQILPGGGQNCLATHCGRLSIPKGRSTLDQRLEIQSVRGLGQERFVWGQHLFQHRKTRRQAKGTVVQGVPESVTSPKEGTELPRLAVFVSGGGSNFKAIHAAILDGRIKAQAALVVSDHPLCEGCKYAAQNGIPVVAYPAEREAVLENSKHNADSPEGLRDLLLKQYAVDYVVLAGYLKLVPPEIVAAFPRAMLNIHPGLLPAFGGKGYYGSRVHKAVISSGARFTGPTVHFVDEDYDTGPILAQRVVPVMPLDDHKQLAARVLKEEHILYPETIAALVGNRISWREDGIPIIWSAH